MAIRIGEKKATPILTRGARVVISASSDLTLVQFEFLNNRLKLIASLEIQSYVCQNKTNRQELER